MENYVQESNPTPPPLKIFTPLFPRFHPVRETGGDPPHYPKNWLVPPMAPHCFDAKCRFCNFHAVFGHFAQIVPPNWEILLSGKAPTFNPEIFQPRPPFLKF